MAGGELWVTENARSAILRVEREETGDAAGFLVGVVGALHVVCSVDRAEPACCHGLHHECSPADASVGSGP